MPSRKTNPAQKPPGSAPDLAYGLDDLPPWPRSLIYGFQWGIIFLPTLVILSSISTEYLGLGGREKVLFFQKILILSGAIMVLQTLWGHRYPLLDGPSSALLLSFIILSSHGMPAMQGGMIAGGLFLIGLSAFRLVRHLEPLFTDNVIGVILILIAVTLLPYLAPMIIGARPGSPSGDPVVFGVSLTVMVGIALFSHWLSGFPKTISLILGILLGTMLMGVLGRLRMGAVWEASWFTIPHPLFSTYPRFSISATVTFLLAYVAVIINAVGSIYSVGEVVGKRDLSRRVARGIGLTGLGGLVAGALGVIGTVSYGISPGVVLVTRVGTRFALTVCGAFLIILAFFQKFLTLVSSIPASVVGAAMITGMAAQVGAGISVIARSERPLEARDYLVIGIPILMGGIISVFPEGFFWAFPFLAHALLKNGLVVGIVLVLVLEHLMLPRKK
ncbi:MAG: purine/pyrimidine permease [Proteobacteria bacterium]|nr:purine/pyrimidine permease [Pseudomonadota bacterium]